MRCLIFTLLLMVTSFALLAQCDNQNPSVESWNEQTISFDDANPSLQFQVDLPDEYVSLYRFLVYAVGIAFGDATALNDYIYDAQAAVGIAQSNDANSGNSAVKLQASSYLNFADLYSVWRCTELPDSIEFSVKHIGTNVDTLRIVSVFDEGLSDIAQDLDDLSAYPAFSTAEFVYDSDTEYENIKLPITKNFEAAIDTAYVLFILSTDQAGLDAGNESYILIDDVRVSTQGVSSTHELANSAINIYPNPAIDFITIDVRGELNYRANLYDLTGQLVKTVINSTFFNIQDIPAGTYLLEIKDLKTHQKVMERIVIGK